MVNGVVYLDLKKAFDTVDHSLLLTKLKYMGLGHSTIDWFKSYLSAKAQTCFVNGAVNTLTKSLLSVGFHRGLFFVFYSF